MKIERAIEFVRLGYADIVGDGNYEFRSLDFETDDLTTVEAQAVIRCVPQYNAFSGEKVAGALEEFRGRISSYRFGRSGSPALSVRLPYTTNQIEERRSPQVGARIAEADHGALLKQMRAVFVQSLGADEFLVDDGKHTIRVRWG